MDFVRISEDAETLSKATGIKPETTQRIIGSFENLKDLASTSESTIQRRTKCTTKQAEKVKACFDMGKQLARSHAERDKVTRATDVADLMMPKMRYLKHEVLCVLCLDTQGGVGKKGVIMGKDEAMIEGVMISEKNIFEGTLNACVFHPREIFRFAIEEAANSIIMVHNHPSGDPQPSQEDIRATKQLIQAGNQIGIKVLDHIIIGDGIFVSLKEENLI